MNEYEVFQQARLIRLRHTQYMLPQIRQDQIIAYGRDGKQPCLAKFPFHIVLGRKTITAVGRKTSVGCFPGRLRGKQFCHIRFSAAFFLAVEFRCCLVTH